jgi:hypothetical protein
VLDDVGERLGDDEVRAGLDVRRQPFARDVDFDGEIQSRRDRVDAGGSPRVDNDGRIPCASSRSSAIARSALSSASARSASASLRFS